jgi:serine/threonine protein kinase/Flp pilus assembly protein TadD
MIGRTVTHYNIIEELGRGGMGVVYKARDTKLDRDVALKFLPMNLTASQEEISRFEQEAKVISSLNHPNIETIYDVDEADGQKYIVLEYIPGGTLKSKLKQLKSEDREFSIGEVLDYGMQTAEGLAHAHRHRIIHRDIKTENIMLTDEGKVKLTDFGLAKLRGTVLKTRTGSTLGTAAYMSPEQVRGEEVDRRSDIFSLGVVLYELVTSHLPFQGEYEAALSYSILNENPRSVKLLRPDIPHTLETIIDRCLEKDKARRYQSAEEIVADLRAVQRAISDTKTILKKKHSRAFWVVAGFPVALAVTGFFILRPGSHAPSANRKSIAVLPFKNLSDSREDEYFSDGITDDIIAQLSKITDMKVISRTSTMHYKESNKHVREIGNELGVATVLEGSVRHVGNQIRIVAQLIDAENEGHLWADTYDKELTQIFSIQSDVAQQIAAALRAKLSPSEKGRIERKQTENTEAYRLYLRGRFHWNKRQLEDIQQAIVCFRQAIEKDPDFALAYAGLASAYVIVPSYSVPRGEWYANAQKTAVKALSIDSTLAEAHTVLGEIAQDQYYDWAGAEKYFRRAIELDPGYPTAHQWYSCTLQCQGRFAEALSEAKAALELDPLSLVISMNLGDVYYVMRRYEKAMEQYKSVLALDPNFPWAHSGLGSVHEMQGRFDESIEEYEKAKSLAGNIPYTLAPLGWIYAKAGRKTDALSVLDDLMRLAQQGANVSYGIGFLYYELGEKDKAFEWIEKSYQNREIWMMTLATDPLWDDLRSDPRCIALLKKMGLRK